MALVRDFAALRLPLEYRPKISAPFRPRPGSTTTRAKDRKRQSTIFSWRQGYGIASKKQAFLLCAASLLVSTTLWSTPIDCAAPMHAALHLTYKVARRIAIGVTGGTILLLGVVMLVTPGPALLVIPIGLAILGLEFAWARLWLKRIRRRISAGFANNRGRDAERYRSKADATDE
jgi:uncharacterized protein (TIGR02611 family)